MSECFCGREAWGHPALDSAGRRHADGTKLCSPYDEIRKLRGLLVRTAIEFVGTDMAREIDEALRTRGPGKGTDPERRVEEALRDAGEESA